MSIRTIVAASVAVAFLAAPAYAGKKEEMDLFKQMDKDFAAMDKQWKKDMSKMDKDWAKFEKDMMGKK